jgi:hypothetical protein
VQKVNIAQRDAENKMTFLEIYHSKSKSNMDVKRKMCLSVPTYENIRNFDIDAQNASVFMKVDKESPMKNKSARKQCSSQVNTFSTNPKKTKDYDIVQILWELKNGGRKRALTEDRLYIPFPNDEISYSRKVSYETQNSVVVEEPMQPKAVPRDPEIRTLSDLWYRQNINSLTSAWL